MSPSKRGASDRVDVLVVGGGPCGASAAYWLAQAGHDVLVVEKRRFPREKTCGDGLTPRSVRQLSDMGLDEQMSGFHRFTGLRSIAHGRSLEMPWPEHPIYPSYGYVARRSELDQMVIENSVKNGASLLPAYEATGPIVEGGLVSGASLKSKDTGEVRDIYARYVIVADGANSRFGRALGSHRNRTYPMGIAIRGYYESPLHSEPWIESHLDIKDKDGKSLPGYGWIFPVGDGTVNVGVGLLSTFGGWKEVNTSRLLDAFEHTAPERWGIRPDTSTGAPTGGKLPTGGSVGPKVGPNYVIAGDAAGSVNPFNGEGIAYAYETGRLAAKAVNEALITGDGRALGGYIKNLEDDYGLYFAVARVFVRAIGNPAVMRELTRVGMHSQPLMEWVLRIMANLMRPEELGPAEVTYKLLERLAAIAGPAPM